MPFDIFDAIKTSQEGLDFMMREFPDSVPIFGEQEVLDQFGPGTRPGLPMVSIKTSPHAVKNSIIVGDAAHAIVPFYGQGMNAGMEDMAVLMDLYDAERSESETKCLKSVIKKYGEVRPKDAHAIAELALYNYIEMRDLVLSRWFLFRGKVDRLLTTVFPTLVIPLYEMVVFSPSIPYSSAISRNKLQGKIIDTLLFLMALLLVIIVLTNPSVIVNAVRLAVWPLKSFLPSSIANALNF